MRSSQEAREYYFQKDNQKMKSVIYNHKTSNISRT